MKPTPSVTTDQQDATTDQHDATTAEKPAPSEEPYCILSEKEKIVSLLVATIINFLPPMSGTMYYPALGPLSRDLGVTSSKINLSITIFMIAQALVPQLTGTLSDYHGRRPVLIICLLIFFGVNIGLALQTNFAALLVLRCFQSFGSAGAAVVSSAITADLITRAERGQYIGYTTLGRSIGPALGPLLGGILTKFLGWRSIFWFLSLLTGLTLLLTILLLRESCRALVGNGSVPTPAWNRPTNHPSILASITPILDKGSLLLLIWSAIFYSGSMAILCTLPALLEETYRFNPLQVGLCYIPYAVGGFVSRWGCGRLSDWNFARYARRVGVELLHNRQTHDQVRAIPLEKARLGLSLPLGYASCLFVIAYGWTLGRAVHVSGPLVLLFCLGVVSGALPLAHATGMGWMGLIIAGVWFVSSKVLWVMYLRGQAWRRESAGCPE